jgi:glutathione S-transferase
MHLYDHHLSPNPIRVRIFLAEKEIDVPTIQVDIPAGEHRSDALLKKNPCGHIPFLELDDGTVISESVAICRYFEGVRPEPALMGVNNLDAAIVEMWQRRIEIELFIPVLDYFKNTDRAFADAVEQIPAYGEACRQRILAMLDVLDTELAGRPYMAGERFTIADITAWVAAVGLSFCGIEIPSNLVHFSRWRDAVFERPSGKVFNDV